MPSVLLPAQLALHVLLLLVLAPDDLPLPPSSPSVLRSNDDDGRGAARLSPAFASSLFSLLLRELLAPEDDGMSFAHLQYEILALSKEVLLPPGDARSEGPRLLRLLTFQVGPSLRPPRIVAPS